MNNKVNVAVLGSTGFVGLELIKILLNHPKVNINFIGSENNHNKNISEFDINIQSSNLPVIRKNEDVLFRLGCLFEFLQICFPGFRRVKIIRERHFIESVLVISRDSHECSVFYLIQVNNKRCR